MRADNAFHFQPPSKEREYALHPCSRASAYRVSLLGRQSTTQQRPRAGPLRGKSAHRRVADCPS